MAGGGLGYTAAVFLGLCVQADVQRDAGLVHPDQRAPSPTYGPEGTLSLRVRAPQLCTGEAERSPTQLGTITSGDYTHRGECQSLWLPECVCVCLCV